MCNGTANHNNSVLILANIGNIWVTNRGGSRGAISPPETYETNFIHHDFVQFGKQHSRCKNILPSIVLTQQSCEIHVISLTVENPQWDWLPNYYWNLSPKLTGWIRPWSLTSLQAECDQPVHLCTSPTSHLGQNRVEVTTNETGTVRHRGTTSSSFRGWKFSWNFIRWRHRAYSTVVQFFHKRS